MRFQPSSAGDFRELSRSGGFVLQEVEGRFQLDELRVKSSACASNPAPTGGSQWAIPSPGHIRVGCTVRRPAVVAGMRSRNRQRLADAAENLFLLGVHWAASFRFCAARFLVRQRSVKVFGAMGGQFAGFRPDPRGVQRTAHYDPMEPFLREPPEGNQRLSRARPHGQESEAMKASFSHQTGLPAMALRRFCRR